MILLPNAVQARPAANATIRNWEQVYNIDRSEIEQQPILAVPKLVEALHDPSPKIRLKVIKILESMHSGNFKGT